MKFINKHQERAFNLARTKNQKALVLGLANLGKSSVFGGCTGDKKGNSRSHQIRGQMVELLRILKLNKIKFRVMCGPRGGAFSAKLSFDKKEWETGKSLRDVDNMILFKSLRDKMLVPEVRQRANSNGKKVVRRMQNSTYFNSEIDRWIEEERGYCRTPLIISLAKTWKNPKSRQAWLDYAGLTETDLMEYGLK